jgi:exodeoxyribonuclease-5
MTLHSLHGLKPNIDLQNFDIENPQFDPLNPSKIQNYNLVVIDECSMINKDLFQLNRNRATTYNVKILYVGDSLQLPPVNEEISLTFATVKNKVVLTDIVRQEEGNPLLELFSLLRDDIKNQTNTFLNYIVRNRSNIQDGIGYEIIPRAMFNQRLIDEFNSDTFHKNIDHFRITAYTNKAVSDWNSIVRNSIVGKDADIIHINDLVLSYNTIVDEFKEPIILNSEDYILEDIRPYISDEGIKTFAVNLKSMYDGHITQPFLIVDTKDASFLKYKEILTHLYNRAANRVQHGWYVYYKFKNRFLTNLKFSIETIQGTKWINKDIDYGYSMTVHKTQGSTFDNVAIDLTDIVFQNTRFGRRENDIDIRNKLMYVALSRARKSVIMKY